MNPVGAIKSVFRNYANFTGVAAPSEFWWFCLLTVIVNIELYSSFTVTGVNFTIGEMNVVDYFAIAWFLVSIVPAWSVTTRRFHDAGWSGKWLFLWIIPAAAWGNAIWMSNESEPSDAAIVGLTLGVPALLLSIAVGIFQLVITLLPSKSAAKGNKYAG